MRIGFDLSAIRHGLTNGVAVYTANLARELTRLDVELVGWYSARSSPAAEAFLDELTALGADIVRVPPPWCWFPDGAWWLPAHPPAHRLFARVDVWHLGEFFLPRPAAIPVVATVHDVTTLTHPRHHLVVNRVVHRRRLRWIKRHVSRIIAVSRSTKRDLVDTLGIDADRISVVYEARGHPDPSERRDFEALRRCYGIPARYILSVGTLEPRKNQKRLIRAFESLPETHGKLDLILVGGKGWHARGVLRAIESSPARDRIRRLGAVPESDLTALYENALVFAYPSLYEGFGLPILEAMAAGTPVLTSNLSSLPEVAGGAAVLVDPRSVESIRSELERLLAEPALRDRLVALGREREADFNWERAARETLAVYRHALGRPVDRIEGIEAHGDESE